MRTDLKSSVCVGTQLKIRQLKKVLDKVVSELSEGHDPLVEIVIESTKSDTFEIYGVCGISQSQVLGDLTFYVDVDCDKDHLVR